MSSIGKFDFSKIEKLIYEKWENSGSFKPKKGCSIIQNKPDPTAKVENRTPKLASNNIVSLSFNS